MIRCLLLGLIFMLPSSGIVRAQEVQQTAPVVAPAPAAQAAPIEPSSIQAIPDATPQPQPEVAATPEVIPQTEEAIEAEETSVEKEINELLSFQKPPVDPNRMPSLFFTVWEHDLLLDARQGLTSRPPDAPEDDGIDLMNVFPPTVVGPRDIGLGGIVYRGKKDWVIWINSVRIAPDAIPSEVIDLKVYKDYIELEWFDQSTRQIYPIRLRPHQRFNLDTRMFLPG